MTVTKPEKVIPAKTKSWNPRDRYFWSVLLGSVSYSIGGDILNKVVTFGSIEYFVLSVVIFFAWWLIVWAMERWVFGPKDG